MPNQTPSLQDQIQIAFREIFARETAVIIRIPGSIQLLGIPFDNVASPALTAAIDRGIWLAAAPSDNQLVTVSALNFQEQGRFQLPFLNVHASSVSGDWINVPVGIAWGLQEAGIEPVGMDVVIAGNVPTGVGLGSSVAVGLALLLAWEAFGDFQMDDGAKADLIHRVERDYLGLPSDMVTPLTCLISPENHLVLHDGSALPQMVPMAETAVLIINPGHPQKTTPPGYADELEKATAVLQQSRPQIETIFDVTEDDLELFGHQLSETARRFALHFIQENGRVQVAANALHQSDFTTFARLMRQSHISVRDNLQTSNPECDLVAATAWQHQDCLGARIGAGGLVVVLVRETAVSTLQQTLQTAFSDQFNRDLLIFQTTLSAGSDVSSN